MRLSSGLAFDDRVQFVAKLEVCKEQLVLEASRKIDNFDVCKHLSPIIMKWPGVGRA